MRRKSLDHLGCSIAKSLDLVGDPWTLLVVRDALLGVSRFEDFHRRLGTPRATLSARLDQLVDAGILDRDVAEDTGNRPEYRPTDKGRALRPVIITLMQWGDRWARDDAPPTTLVDLSTGETIDPVLVDRSSGTPLEQLRVQARGSVTEHLSRRDHAAL